MAENSKIEWCDHTFNPWEGCQKVGPGCDNCYAEARNARFAGGQAINWGPGAPRRRTIPLLPAALEALQALRQHTQLAADRVTVNPRSRRDDKAWDTNKLADVWDRAHKGTGVALRNPYQLRHTFASQLLSQGENPALIAKLLGHKTIEMVTRTYDEGGWPFPNDPPGTVQ